MSADFDRGLVLFGQSRFDLAEAFFRQATTAEPGSWGVHAFLAYCLGVNKRVEPALREAAEAVRLGPEQGWAFHALAKARLSAKILNKAEEAINEALRLEPRAVEHHALKSAILFTRRRWLRALACAEAGLTINPESQPCANLRSLSLLELHRTDEAFKTSGSVLGQNPENALGHATRGWTLLELGDDSRALEHFKESLRLDPRSEYAREGMKRAQAGCGMMRLPFDRSRKIKSGTLAGIAFTLIALGRVPQLLIALDEHSGSLARMTVKLVPAAVLATVVPLVLVMLWVPSLVIKHRIRRSRAKISFSNKSEYKPK